MKTLIEYILEYRTTDVMKIYFGSKEINPSIFIYDKESLDNFIQQYKNNKFDDKELRLCKLNDNKWKVLKNVCKLNLLRMNDEFIVFGNKFFTYDDIIDKLQSGSYILIMI